MPEWLRRLVSLAQEPGPLIIAALVASTLFALMFNGGSND